MTQTPFNHFDRSHTENFCAAVLLFMMDIDPDGFGLGLKRSLLAAVELPEGPWKVVGVTREVNLAPTEAGTVDRADLVVRLQSGANEKTLLVEVKTHSAWDESAVAAQVRRQGAERTLLDGTAVHQVLLLAPRTLSDSVRRMDNGLQALAWEDLVLALQQHLSGLPSTTLRSAAIEHLAAVVGAIPTAESLTGVTVAQSIESAGRLEGLLERCIRDLGGKNPQKLHIPRDGRPVTHGNWTYRALQRRFTRAGRAYWIGIYDYVKPSPKRGTFLELYSESNGYLTGIKLRDETLHSAAGYTRFRMEFQRQSEEVLRNL